MSTKKQHSQEVATKEQDQSMVAAGMFEAEEAQGFEHADRDSFAIPFLQLLQKMSPQVDEGEDGYVEGARPGMYVNTVTEELFPGDPGVLVVPCHYERRFIEWVPRSAGGGFVADHPPEHGLKLMQQTTRDENNRDILPESGNELQDTRQHYVLILREDGNWEPAIVSMTRTAQKASKRWMTMMQNIKWPRKGGGYFTPPMFSHVYRLGVQRRSNDQGTWYVPNPAKERPLGEGDEELFHAAKGFRDQIVQGEARAAYDSVDTEGGSTAATDTDNALDPEQNEDIPF